MLNYNLGYDPYDGNNKGRSLLELVVTIRRALFVRSLYDTLRNIAKLLVTRIIPNAIPGLIVFVVLPRMFHFDPIFTLDPQQTVLKYGHSFSPKQHAVFVILAYSVLGVLDMLFRGLMVLAVQYVFWSISQLKPSRQDTGLSGPRPPNKGMGV